MKNYSRNFSRKIKNSKSLCSFLVKKIKFFTCGHFEFSNFITTFKMHLKEAKALKFHLFESGDKT